MKLRHQLTLAVLGVLLAPAAIVIADTLRERWGTKKSNILIFQDRPLGPGVEWKMRKMKLGQSRWWFEDEEGNLKDDRVYTGAVLEIGIRKNTAKWTPTDDEFDDWLALPDWHPHANDLDGYLESVR